jgi:CRP/FNR family cyclic AMP-dependent transcriptional regulator
VQRPNQLFDRLPEGERRALRAASRRRRFAKGDTIFFEGDPGDTLHVIDRGHVAIRVSTPDGDVVTLEVLSSGDSFGELALTSGEWRRSASAVCLDPVETVSIRQPEFDELRRRLPAVDRFLVEVLSNQVRRLTSLLLDSLHLDADTRTYRQLHRLATVYAAGSPPIVIPLTQSDLASMVGTTRPTINKALQSAAERGLVSLARGRITIIDLKGLSKQAQL